MIHTTGSNPAGLTAANARQVLKKRAEVLAKIRQYFSARKVLEVETPLLDSFAVTDPQLTNLRVQKPFSKAEWLYLQTSPEYAMKKLLAKGSGSIYQICKAFREDPVGKLHNTEFTMLEWYREGFSLTQLMDDVAQLATALMGDIDVETISYRQAFKTYLDIDVFTLPTEQLAAFARSKIDIDSSESDRDFWLDLLLSHFVEKELGRGRLTFVVDYPRSQAALAKLTNDVNGNCVAKRFELYIDGVEIANGYQELTDAQSYRERFLQDNILRRQRGLAEVPIDDDFLQSIEAGLPECAGVALGLDRLLLFA